MGRAQHVDWRFAVFNAKQNNQKPIPGVSPLKASLYMPGNLNKWHDKEFDVSVYAAGDHALKLPGGIQRRRRASIICRKRWQNRQRASGGSYR